jgi:tetratricopeptide (TPR) repeat protein
MGERAARKVLLIGWDGADWKAIMPLLDAGKMPALERLVNAGVMGNLATLHPPLSPMLWTSIATGMRPFKHGIHGFTEPDPHTGGIRPVSSTSRTKKAIWNILMQNGLKSNVIGWWPSHPAEPIDGVMISNHYHRAVAPLGKPWPMAPGTVHPERLAGPLSGYRLHPAELTAEQILPFVPRAAEIDPKEDPRLETAARILAECASVHACATAVMQLEPWDFMAVYYDAIDHFSHGFMRYHPPRQDHIAERDFDLYSGVVEAGYRFHDMMLGVLRKLAGPDATVILISDHGFHSDHLRPARIPHEPAGPAVEHSPYGIFVMAGPGVREDERIYGASLLDIAPTILTLFDLPVGEDVDGKPLVQCFESPPAVRTLPSWETVAGEAGLLPEDRRQDPAEAREAIQQLVDLGYIEDPGEKAQEAVAKTVAEGRYNLARAYIDACRHADALPLLEGLWKSAPDELRFGNRLAHCYRVLGRLGEYRGTVEALLATRERLASEARRRLAEHAQKAKKEAEAGEAPAESSPTEAQKAEQRELNRLRAMAAPSPHWADYLMGSLLFTEGKPLPALDRLRRAEAAQPRLPYLHSHIGQIYLHLQQWEDAERAFRRAIEIDPDSADAYLGLCRSLLPRRRNLDAAEEALTAVGLLHHYPEAHFYLGVALHRVGYIERAVEALEVALTQNPNFAEAHRRLAYISERRLGDPKKAAHHRRLARELKRRNRKPLGGGASAIAAAAPEGAAEETGRPVPEAPPEVSPHVPAMTIAQGIEPAAPPADAEPAITVVSGLPRSGTSMMMQMLHAGGHPCLIDGERGADDDNPRGYFEIEKVKRLRTDASWLRDARGRALKIVAPLLMYLPAALPCRVLFMERDLHEVVASQRRMLERQGRTGAALSDDRLRETFARQLRQVRRLLAERAVPTLWVSYRDAVERPTELATRVHAFLGGALDEVAMADAVDRRLYRQRKDDCIC